MMFIVYKSKKEKKINNLPVFSCCVLFVLIFPEAVTKEGILICAIHCCSFSSFAFDTMQTGVVSCPRSCAFHQ